MYRATRPPLNYEGVGWEGRRGHGLFGFQTGPMKFEMSESSRTAAIVAAYQ